MTDPTNTDAADKGETSPVYLNDSPRFSTIALLHPFAIAGREIREVSVRRLRGFEAKSFAQAAQAAAVHGKVEPMFPGIELSAEEYAALDDDDVWAIDQVVEGFLPARFQALTALAEKLQGLDNSPTGDQ